MHLAIALVLFAARCRADLLEECAKLFRPQGHQHLPYIGDVAIPINVRPTPVARTKAVKVTTEYIYRNPVCVKYAKGKRACKRENAWKGAGVADQLVTKEYFVKGRRKRRSDEEDEESEYFLLQGSETPRLFGRDTMTPVLSDRHVHDMLIEDRLDQLETILPHYTRRRLYETSTITVTKVLSNRRTMATLLVKNCVPHGFEVCTAKKRKSKMAEVTSRDDKGHHFRR